jgi:hypothetical protein
MSVRENFRMGIFYAIIAGLFIFCLIGAFVLPPAVTSSRTLGWVGLVGLLASPISLIFVHRSRIRNAVEDKDGILVSMKRVGRWSPGYWHYRSLGRTRYKLEYIDDTGATHHALSNSGWISGVEWLEDQVVSDQLPPSEVN